MNTNANVTNIVGILILTGFFLFVFRKPEPAFILALIALWIILEKR